MHFVEMWFTHHNYNVGGPVSRRKCLKLLQCPACGRGPMAIQAACSRAGPWLCHVWYRWQLNIYSWSFRLYILYQTYVMSSVREGVHGHSSCVQPRRAMIVSLLNISSFPLIRFWSFLITIELLSSNTATLSLYMPCLIASTQGSVLCQKQKRSSLAEMIVKFRELLKRAGM